MTRGSSRSEVQRNTDRMPLAKRPRQTDVARRAGVSPATVSKVINGGAGISPGLRKRVLQAMEALGLHPDEARRRLGALPHRICLITYAQFLALDSSYFHAEVLRAITAECAAYGMRIDRVLLDRDAPNDPGAYRRHLAELEFDAALMVGLDDQVFLEPLRAGRVPVVIVNGHDRLGLCDSVSPAARQASYLAAQHLLACGHREIMHITHLFRPVIQQRLEGFRDALEQAGIPFDPARHVLNIDCQVFSTERAASVIEQRVRQGQLTATGLHCVSDYTALGVIRGLVRAGRRVPADHSVVSYDDLPIAALCEPPLTAAGVDRTSLGRLAVKRLIERFQAPAEPAQRIELAAHLCSRASVRVLAAPASAPPTAMSATP